MNEQDLRNLLTEPMQLVGLVGKSATAREKLVEWCKRLPEAMAAMEPRVYVPVKPGTIPARWETGTETGRVSSVQNVPRALKYTGGDAMISGGSGASHADFSVRSYNAAETPEDQCACPVDFGFPVDGFPVDVGGRPVDAKLAKAIHEGLSELGFHNLPEFKTAIGWKDPDDMWEPTIANELWDYVYIKKYDHPLDMFSQIRTALVSIGIPVSAPHPDWDYCMKDCVSGNHAFTQFQSEQGLRPSGFFDPTTRLHLLKRLSNRAFAVPPPKQKTTILDRLRKNSDEKVWTLWTVADLTQAMTRLGWHISSGWSERTSTEKLCHLRNIRDGKPQRSSPQIAMVQNKLGLEHSGVWGETTAAALKKKLNEPRLTSSGGPVDGNS